jgi:DNA-binding GntR family transcriptional regulator
MSRTRTADAPDLSALLRPQTPLMVAIQHAILRDGDSPHAAAPIAAQIAVRLAGAIAMDLLHAGQRLLEKDLGAVLRVSRAPVREALRILQREHLVDFEPRRGALVTAPDAQDLRDIYLVRTALYGILMRRLMERRPADVRATFDRHLPAIEAAARQESVDGFSLASFQLNMTLVELSDHRVAADLLASISVRTLRYVRLGLAADPARIRGSLASWQALRRAVDRDDADEVTRHALLRIDASRDAALRALGAPPPAGLSGTAASAPARSRPSARSRPPSAQSASGRPTRAA